MKKRYLVVCLIALLPYVPVYGENGDEPEAPSYSQLMLRNALVPGLGLEMMGNGEEARLYYSALPMNVLGVGLIALAVFRNENGIEATLESRSGETTLFQYKNALCRMNAPVARENERSQSSSVFFTNACNFGCEKPSQLR